MEIITLPTIGFASNCFILHNGNEAFVIDPSISEKKIQKRLCEEGLSLKGILLTHGHFDHIWRAQELREETGALCETLTHIGDIVPSPAILTERISMYLAEGLSFTDTDYDEGEFIEIVRIPLPELVEMIMRGKIEDAKTQTAILKVWNLKNK